MPTILSRDDIKSLIERVAGIKVVSSANVRGVREYHSNCPWCGGTDRFITRPETGQYTCATRSSGCGRHGDGIDFLREYSNMSMDEAIRELALEDVSFYENKPEKTQSLNEPPPKEWQNAACALIARATDCLWHSEEGKQALEYLRGRGLSDSILKKMYIGYVPLQKDGRWYSDTFEGWGLDPMKLSPAQYAKGCVRVPNGILIPWCEGTAIWKLAVKRPGEEMDYGQVLGSAEGLYNIGAVQYGKPAMLVEGEFDALSVMQEAGDLVACIATGSAARGRSPRWKPELEQASFLIQSFDDDEGGHSGAVWWLSEYEKCYRFEPVQAKDANDMLRAYDGKYVRDWVQAGLGAWDCLQWPASLPIPTAPASTFTEEETKAALLYAEMARVACLQMNLEMNLQMQQEEEEMAPHWQNLLAKVEQQVAISDYLPDAQAEFERLCISERVQTPEGPGKLWDSRQLKAHCERGQVRVSLDSGRIEMFAPCQLEPVLETFQLAF